MAEKKGRKSPDHSAGNRKTRIARQRRTEHRQDHAPRKWFSRIEKILRWWSSIFFGFIIVNLLGNILFALAGAGPSAVPVYFQSFRYMALLAITYPLPFWIVTVFLVGTACIGAGLLGMEIWQKRRRRRKQREIYLKAVEDNYQEISLVIDPDLKIPLPRPVYQRLSYLRRPGSQDQEKKTSYIQAEYITEVLNTEGLSVCIVLLGDPGGGKTTFLRQSMFDLAQKAQKDANVFLPVYIALPAFAKFLARNEQTAVKDYLLDQDSLLVKMRITNYADTIQNAVENGQVFLFVDSLDEVDPGNRRLVINWVLKQQATIASQGAIVLGTRYTDYDPAQFAPRNRTLSKYQEFTELVAQPMDHDIRVQLANNLFGPLMEQIKKLFPDIARTLNPPDVYEFIKLVEQTAQQETLLGENPLLFSLAAYLFVRGERQSLPTSRVMLYGTFIEALLTKVVLRQQQKETGKREMEILRKVFHVLAEVALWTFTDLAGSIGFTEREMTSALDAMREKWHIECDSAWVVDSGALKPVEKNKRYEFRHHTVQEYLAAAAVSERLLSERLRQGTWDLLREKRFIAQWTQPMRMLAGVLVMSEQDVPGASKYVVEWMDDLSQIAINMQDIKQFDALELAVASLPEIPDIASFGEQINVSSLLTVWAKTLLQVALAGQTEWVDRFQRLGSGVSLLPPDSTKSAVESLLQALADESEPAGQIAAAQVLEKLGSLITDISVFIQVLHDSRAQKEVRIAVAHTLAVLNMRDGVQSLGHIILEEDLEGADSGLANIIAMALNGAGDLSRHLMEIAVETERDKETRRLGTIALGSLGEPAKTRLEELMEDDEAIVAATAAEILQNLGAPKEELRKRLLELAEHGGEILEQLQSILPQSLRRLGYTVIVYEGHEVIIPPVCAIPAGEFLMGSDKRKDKEARDNELPQHRVRLEEYAIGKYPLTVAEYGMFVEATHRAAPRDWDTQKKRPEHPVVYVSWEDVQAYAKWLGEVTGEKWRLPSEAEWEKAARGTDGRIYPWGNEWDASRANTWEKGPHETTPVGSYPQGASPYGVMDMAGNVWEWTNTVYKEYPYDAGDGREDVNSINTRVLRGGSWGGISGLARAASRFSNWQDVSNNYGGARLAVSRFAAGSKRT